MKLFSHLAIIGERQIADHPPGHHDPFPNSQPEEQAQTGVSPEYVRLSIGIEDIRDITADLDQALKASQR